MKNLSSSHVYASSMKKYQQFTLSPEFRPNFLITLIYHVFIFFIQTYDNFLFEQRFEEVQNRAGHTQSSDIYRIEPFMPCQPEWFGEHLNTAEWEGQFQKQKPILPSVFKNLFGVILFRYLNLGHLFRALEFVLIERLGIRFDVFTLIFMLFKVGKFFLEVLFLQDHWVN